ncbi:MAG: glycosyltransferase family 2 protein [Rikenellaceae bacterium]
MKERTNILVSVIVPAYNAERYIDQCLNSIRKQSLHEIEIIIINDGSKDQTLSKIKKHSDKDNRIVLIDKDNEGVDKASFDGIAIAKGKYITFVDSDDWLENPNLLKTVYHQAEENSADVVEFAYRKVFDSLGLISISHNLKLPTGVYPPPQLFNDLFISFFGVNRLGVQMWCHLYRRDLIQSANLSMSGYSRGQDLVFNMKLFPFIKRYYISNAKGYCYRHGGVTDNPDSSLLANHKKIYYLKKSYLDKYNYTKGYFYIKIEMKNILKTHILQILSWDKKSESEVKQIIAEELQDELWREVVDVESQEPFFLALKSGDVDQIYNNVYSDYKRGLWKSKFKRFAFKLVSSIIR